MPESDAPVEVVYTGYRDDDGVCHVEYKALFANGAEVHGPLSVKVSQAIRNHSPTGFEWGYAGSGPAQLALALVLDAHNQNRDVAEPAYQKFKFAFVVGWKKSGWTIRRSTIIEWVKAHVP